MHLKNPDLPPLKYCLTCILAVFCFSYGIFLLTYFLDVCLSSLSVNLLSLCPTGLHTWWGQSCGSLFCVSSSLAPSPSIVFFLKETSNPYLLNWHIPLHLISLSLFFAETPVPQDPPTNFLKKERVVVLDRRFQGEWPQINYSCQRGKCSNYLINSSVVRNQPLDSPEPWFTRQELLFCHSGRPSFLIWAGQILMKSQHLLDSPQISALGQQQQRWPLCG